MTDDERDELLNDATHAVAAEFAERGIDLEIEALYRINDLLTAFLDTVQEPISHLEIEL